MAAKTELRFRPDYAVPPGATLLETIETLGISQAELARRTGRPVKTINEIVKGKVSITPETALQFERVLGIPAMFWINREGNYREALTRKAEHMGRLESQCSCGFQCALETIRIKCQTPH